MSVERVEGPSATESSPSPATGLGDQARAIPDSREEKKHPETRTLGVLLVHGIGSQGRGDTLVQCTNPLHNWMRAWLKHGGCDFTTELADVSIAEAGPDHPAQAKIIFRRRREISEFSWLIAESCWSETYRRPGFYEFMRWALWVIPFALLVHFIPNYRRMYFEFEVLREAGNEATRRLQEKSRSPNADELEDLKRRKFHFARNSAKMVLRLCVMQGKLSLAVIFGLVVQLLLIVIGALTVIPGITRSLAGWVQRKVSQTLGDSYLFLTSPVTEAAIVTRVKRDLEWLMARTDQVIVLAHSQGAAVSYRAIEREFWDGGRIKNLSLVTYGSGLRKLFDLEKNVMPNLRFWIILVGSSIILSVLMAALIVLFLGGIVPLWPVLLGLLVGLLLQMFPLIAPNAPKVSYQDPTVLRVPWLNLYSSHDPVPNGPMAVVPTEEGVWSADLILWSSQFETLQCEVVNWRSLLSDHTSYWSNPDDFVGRIANILAKASDIDIHFTLDNEWLMVSQARRLWRVTWLSRCRAVTGLTALSILFWPHDMLATVGIYVREAVKAAMAELPEKWTAWMPATLGSDWLIGAAGLALCTYVVFLVALGGWTLWERQEAERFFRRAPYRSLALAALVFALGWVGVLVSAPAYALAALAQAHSQWASFGAVLWAPLTMAVWSAWIASNSGPGPGNPLEWARTALARAEALLADKKRDRIEALRQVYICFGRAEENLAVKHFGSEEWVRAVLGRTQVVQELAKSNSAFRDRAAKIYQNAIDVLKRARRDASEVQSRLEEAVAASNG